MTLGTYIDTERTLSQCDSNNQNFDNFFRTWRLYCENSTLKYESNDRDS
jgi:hypothetical protein